MKKIGTITFHASYNYGSCLQAFALQEFVKEISSFKFEYHIINLRTNIQKEMYANWWAKRGFKNYLKKVLFHRKKNELLIKEKLFEKFISKKLQVTREYDSLDELKKSNLSFDYYISGSDQLWNLRARDFDWSYYLEFVKSGTKISYAASFGDKNQMWTEEEAKRVKDNLDNYDFLSVRENSSYNIVKKLTNKKAEINIDPTMLLTKEDWNKIVSREKIINKKYIFFYNLKGDKESINIAKKIGKRLKLPVIISKCSNIYELHGFKTKFDVGPLEFLNLIKNAELVISTSFHGTVFSIIFNTPFFAIKGNEDYRITTLLEKMGMSERTIDRHDIDIKLKKAFDVDFSNIDNLLRNEREKSKIFLQNSLNINK